ncbi:MAG: type IV pilus twitching motility protein PilT [Candidatus Omnitrophota bacterium]|nr:type IV pilus twitching motility protein PilT [Candidatus Omnitrophota bacterium]
MDFNKILEMCVEHNASDIHLTVGNSPLLRIDDKFHPLEKNLLKPNDIEKFMKEITSEENQRKLEQVGGAEFGIGFGEVARFRVSIYKQKGYLGMALRLIPYKLMGFEEIGLPPIIKELLYRPRGLILVTGPTGSGKTTTLATMINYINIQRDCHIVTIEDPIEYYHQHKKSIITQREVEVDVPSFSEAVIRGLRQDPDVMLIGEMRDLATMQAAITAAETGHLVLATLHTTGAAQTMDRLIGAFPTDQQEQVRIQLSLNIAAIISQLLLVKTAKSGGRVAVFEIMIATPAIRNLIREDKTFMVTSEIQTGARYGMKTMDTSLADLYNRQIISYEDAIAKAFDPKQVQEKITGTEKK